MISFQHSSLKWLAPAYAEFFLCNVKYINSVTIYRNYVIMWSSTGPNLLK